MRSAVDRMETFRQWPNRITARKIAGAGFYFVGPGDRVKCFYCNGGLQNWDRDEDPWVEHAKWYPT